MNEFTEMIKEAFVGDEPFDPSPGREALQASVDKFERRDRVVRFMSWFAVAFMGAVAFWAGWSFWKSESTKMLILYATIFLWAMIGIGWAKMFLFQMQSSIALMKEIKRSQLMWVGRDPSEWDSSR